MIEKNSIISFHKRDLTVRLRTLCDGHNFCAHCGPHYANTRIAIRLSVRPSVSPSVPYKLLTEKAQKGKTGVNFTGVRVIDVSVLSFKRSKFMITGRQNT